jgi:hypothetical protein
MRSRSNKVKAAWQHAAFFMNFMAQSMTMTLQEFKDSLLTDQPPKNLGVHLLSLWWGGKGDWHRAHDLVQDGQDSGTSWIHAWLHRVEGDEGNASYWYGRAGRRKPDLPLDREWEQLAAHFLDPSV